MSLSRFAVAFLAVTLLFACVSRDKKSQSNNKIIAGPYHLRLPAGWTREHIPFPIPFVPSITYDGTEDAFFTPGWGNKESQDYWSYAFLWSLTGRPIIDSISLQNDLKAYYDGLVADNVRRRAIPGAEVVQTQAIIVSNPTEPGDSATYSGTIHMLDYMALQSMTLHCKVHYLGSDTTGHTAVLFNISPKTFEQSVWQDFKDIKGSFGLN